MYQRLSKFTPVERKEQILFERHKTTKLFFLKYKKINNYKWILENYALK